MLNGHGGNVQALAQRLGCRPEEIIDVSSNINPLGPPPGLMVHLREHLPVICRLPEVDSRSVCALMASSLGLDQDRILAGAGTTQFIHTMFQVLQSHRVLIAGPTYSDYADACAGLGVTPSYYLTEEGTRFQPDMDLLEQCMKSADTVIICNPNNPTGAMILKEELFALCKLYPDKRFVIDESYLSFVSGGEEHSMIGSRLANVIVLHSLSKIHRLAGLRIGFAIAPPQIIEAFKRHLPPWSLNSLAQATVRYLVEHEESVAEFIRRSRDFIAEERRRFMLHLESIPSLKAFPSCANFLLINLPQSTAAGDVCAQMAQRRILVRDCSNFHGLNSRFIRIAFQQREVNERVANVLSTCLSGSEPKEG